MARTTRRRSRRMRRSRSSRATSGSETTRVRAKHSRGMWRSRAGQVSGTSGAERTSYTTALSQRRRVSSSMRSRGIAHLRSCTRDYEPRSLLTNKPTSPPYLRKRRSPSSGRASSTADGGCSSTGFRPSSCIRKWAAFRRCEIGSWTGHNLRARGFALGSSLLCCRVIPDCFHFSAVGSQRFGMRQDMSGRNTVSVYHERYVHTARAGIVMGIVVNKVRYTMALLILRVRIQRAPYRACVGWQAQGRECIPDNRRRAEKMVV